MRERACLLIIIFLTAAAGAPAAESPEVSARVLEKSIQQQLAGRVALPTYVSLAPARAPATTGQPRPEGAPAIDPNRHYLSALPSYYIGVKRYNLTRAECTMRGASMGLGFGMMLGALGTTTGLIGDDDAYYVIGAMSVLGALMGGSMGYQNSSFSTEWRWEAAKRQFDWRDEQRQKFDWEK